MTRNDHFDLLVAKSKQAPLNVIIEGTPQCFTIKAKPLNLVFLFSFLLYMATPILLLNRDITNYIFWIIFIIMLASVLILVWFFTPYDVTIDSLNQKITIKSTNLLGQYFIPLRTIHFKDFKAFSYETVNVSAKGFAGYKNKIYIHANNSKHMILELPYNSNMSIEPKDFIDNLTHLISQ